MTTSELSTDTDTAPANRTGAYDRYFHQQRILARDT